MMRVKPKFIKVNYHVTKREAVRIKGIYTRHKIRSIIRKDRLPYTEIIKYSVYVHRNDMKRLYKFRLRIW